MEPRKGTGTPEGEPDCGPKNVDESDTIETRKRESQSAPRLKIVRIEGEPQIIADHPSAEAGNRLLMQAIGTSDEDFLSGVIEQLSACGLLTDTNEERRLNFVLAVVKGIEPQDEIEAMLALQMAAVHLSSMRFAGQLVYIEHTPQPDSVQRALNQLARTYTMQMDALKRYRSGGAHVTVRHVSVSEGGQAIVGTITHAPRKPRAAARADRTARAAAPSITPPQEQPMPLIVEAEPAAENPGSAAARLSAKPSIARPRRRPGK
jgi:hypothetical protein